MMFKNLPTGSVVHVQGFAIMHKEHYETLLQAAKAYMELGTTAALLAQNIERYKAVYSQCCDGNVSASAIEDVLPAANSVSSANEEGWEVKTFDNTDQFIHEAQRRYNNPSLTQFAGTTKAYIAGQLVAYHEYATRIGAFKPTKPDGKL